MIAPDVIPELISRLTPRQLEIVELLVLGNNNKQVGSILSISGETVRRHIYAACRRVEVENRTQLIVMYATWKAVN